MAITKQKISKLLNELDYKDRLELINSFDLKDILYLIKSDLFKYYEIREICVNALLKVKKSELNLPEVIFFQKFKSLYELHKVNDIHRLEEEFFDYNCDNFFQNYFRFYKEHKLENLFSKNELMLLKDIIDFKDYIINLNPLYRTNLMNDEFIYLFKIKLDTASNEDKKELALVYLNKIYELFIDDFKKLSIEKIRNLKNIIRRLNINKYLLYINIEKFNSNQFSIFEMLLDEDSLILTSKFKKNFFDKKIKFYGKNEKIIINHLASINSYQLTLKDQFINALDNKLFNKTSSFYFDNKYIDKDILKSIIKNGYLCSHILNYEFFDGDLNAIKYLKTHIDFLDESNYQKFFHPDDLLYLKTLDFKYGLFKKDFFNFFKINADSLINDSGRLQENGIALIYINFSI